MKGQQPTRPAFACRARHRGARASGVVWLARSICLAEQKQWRVEERSGSGSLAQQRHSLDTASHCLTGMSMHKDKEKNNKYTPHKDKKKNKKYTLEMLPYRVWIEEAHLLTQVDWFSAKSANSPN